MLPIATVPFLLRMEHIADYVFNYFPVTALDVKKVVSRGSVCGFVSCDWLMTGGLLLHGTYRSVAEKK